MFYINYTTTCLWFSVSKSDYSSQHARLAKQLDHLADHTTPYLPQRKS